MSLAPGIRLGRYAIQGPLGAGGMGEIYRAADPEIGRDVAVKVLPESFQIDRDRVSRFEQEARAAGALDHPNLITVFDVGRHDGHVYMVMELLKGETLRQKLSSGRLPVAKAVDYAAQIAHGLAAAHERGIVHRDLKPENVMVTPDGRLKVLDFGLAKLQAQPEPADDDAATARRTSTGVIMGTAGYMSPEQVRGEPVDARSDIFSLGIILYEMLGSRHPFGGGSAIERMNHILQTEPPPIRNLNKDVPPALAEVLEKALAKDREWRYASAADLRIDLLRALRTPPEQARAKPGRLMRWAVPLLLLSIAGALLALFQQRQAGDVPAPTGAAIEVTSLTLDGAHTGEPTFAPDGGTLAYVSDRSGNFEIYLKQISGGPDINLTNDPGDDVQPSFSPDGKEIAFVSSRSSVAPLVYPNARSPLIGGDIWVMPAFGGMARRVVVRGNFPSWTADGKSLLYVQGPWSGQKIYRVSPLGEGPVEIPVRLPKKSLFLFKPLQSPDGKWIVFGTQQEEIYVAPSAGGDARLVARGWEAAWKGRSDALVYSDVDRNLTLSEVVIDPTTGGVIARRPLTVGRGRDAEPVVSRDGRMIAFGAHELSFNIERIRFDAEAGKIEGSPEVLTRGPAPKMFFDVSPDQGSLVYQARVNGTVHLWRQDLGKEPVQLTRDDTWRDNFPVWSPDGTQIAFVRNRAGGEETSSEIWTVRPDGSSPRLLVRKNSGMIAWSPDGKSISYQSADDSQVYLFDLRTSMARKLTSIPNVRTGTRFTSDGEWVIHAMVNRESSTDVGAVPVSGGPSIAVITTPRDDFHPFDSPSSRWVYAMVDHKNLIRVPGPAQGWRKAPPEQVTFFPESNLMLEDGHISRDGKWLYYTRRKTVGDIWLMRRSDGAPF